MQPLQAIKERVDYVAQQLPDRPHKKIIAVSAAWLEKDHLRNLFAPKRARSPEKRDQLLAHLFTATLYTFSHFQKEVADLKAWEGKEDLIYQASLAVLGEGGEEFFTVIIKDPEEEFSAPLGALFYYFFTGVTLNSGIRLYREEQMFHQALHHYAGEWLALSALEDIRLSLQAPPEQRSLLRDRALFYTRAINIYPDPELDTPLPLQEVTYETFLGRRAIHSIEVAEIMSSKFKEDVSTTLQLLLYIQRRLEAVMEHGWNPLIIGLKTLGGAATMLDVTPIKA